VLSVSRVCRLAEREAGFSIGSYHTTDTHVTPTRADT